MAKKRGPAQEAPADVEALDLFTVKRKRGKPSGQYESHSLQMGKASFRKRRKMAQDYVAPGDGGW